MMKWNNYAYIKLFCLCNVNLYVLIIYISADQELHETRHLCIFLYRFF